MPQLKPKIKNMEQLINMVKEKAGISEAQAKQAVETVVNFVKDKLPAGMQGQVDSFLAGKAGSGSSSMGDMAGGLKDKMGGMFGNK
jgi:hypothetical protein